MIDTVFMGGGDDEAVRRNVSGKALSKFGFSSFGGSLDSVLEVSIFGKCLHEVSTG